MSFQVKCDRCDRTQGVEWLNVDTGYWTAPKGWLTVEPGQNRHLCPECKARALAPEDDPPRWDTVDVHPHTHHHFSDDAVAPITGLREMCDQGICPPRFAARSAGSSA